MRQTKTRQEIYSFLSNNHQAYTPYEISEKLGINAVTVYRVLDFLKGQKLVHHIPALGKWSACQCTSLSEDHGFMICRKCDSVEEFLSPHHCLHTHGFQCEEHVLEVFGLCIKCKNISTSVIPYCRKSYTGKGYGIQA